MLVEVVTFTVGDDVSDFDSINARFQEDVAYQTAGLARRTVARSDDGTWVDVRLWSSDAVPPMDGDRTVIEKWNASVTVVSSAVYRAL